VVQHARLVPFLAVFAAAAQVGRGIDAAHLQPGQAAGGKRGHQGDVKAAVAIEQGRIPSVQGHVPVVGEEHGDLRAVAARHKDLAGDVRLGVKGERGRKEHLTLLAGQVVAKDGDRVEKGLEGVKELVVAALPGELQGVAQGGDGAERGQLDSAQRGAAPRKTMDLVVGMVQIKGNELVVRQAYLVQYVAALGDEGPPRLPLRMFCIHGDEPATGRLEVRAQVKERTIVAHKVVGSLHLGDELDDGAPGGQVLVKQPVADVGALPDLQDQVTAILGGVGAKSPLLLVRTLVDQQVALLRLAQPVQVELLVVVDTSIVGAGRGSVVAGIVKARAVGAPCRTGELAPLDEVGQVLARGDVAHPPG
jgi:hypothetical protein